MKAIKKLSRGNGHALRHLHAKKGLLKFNRLGSIYKKSLKNVKRKPLISIGAALAAMSTLSGLLLWYRAKK